MRRPLLLCAALVAAVAIFAIRLAPATLADARLARLTNGNVRLADTTGTLWDARGALSAGATRIPIAWRIDPWPLLRGDLRLHLAPRADTAGGSPRADVAIQGERVEVTGAQVTFPAGIAVAVAGSTAGWTVGGDIDLDTARFEWAPPSIRGDLAIRWRAARLVPPGNAGPLDLGDVTVMLRGGGDRLSGPVANVGGDLAVRGEIALRAASGIELSVVLTPRRADQRELAQALSVLGSPDGDGWRFAGRYPIR
ncbi:MAG: type II secretion system protein N [Betaproteobacteria bacterium]